jgi:hypothetical protein
MEAVLGLKWDLLSASPHGFVIFDPFYNNDEAN